MRGALRVQLPAQLTSPLLGPPWGLLSRECLPSWCSGCSVLLGEQLGLGPGLLAASAGPGAWWLSELLLEKCMRIGATMEGVKVYWEKFGGP